MSQNYTLSCDEHEFLVHVPTLKTLKQIPTTYKQNNNVKNY